MGDAGKLEIWWIRNDEWFLIWLTHNSVYQQREYFLGAWRWLHFLPGKLFQQWNSSWWLGLSEGQQSEPPSLRVWEHRRASPSCWKPASSQIHGSMALPLMASHVSHECLLQLHFLPFLSISLLYFSLQKGWWLKLCECVLGWACLNTLHCALQFMCTTCIQFMYFSSRISAAAFSKYYSFPKYIL